MNYKFDKLKFKLIILYFAISYICICFGLYIFYPSKIPNIDLIIFQLSLFTSFVVFLFVGLHLNLTSVLFLILFYQLTFTIILYLYFVNVVGNPFGYNPVDADFYLSIVEYSMAHTFKEYLSYLQYLDIETSDYGFPFIQRLIFKIGGNLQRGIFLMCILNTFSLTIGSYFLYKLSLFFFDNNSSKIIALLWGINSCSIWSNVSGLKESIFTTILIITMFLMYLYFTKKTIKNFILLTVFLCVTTFFRFYLSLFFLLIIFFKPLYLKFSNKILLIASVLLLILGTYTGYFITSELPIISSILHNQDYRGDNPIVNMIVGFIGPLPNYFQQTSTDALLYTPYSAFKIFISIFTLIAIYDIIKSQKYQLYPLVLFVYFNIILVIASVFSFDYRFSYTMIPFFYLLALYGINISRKILIFSVILFFYYSFAFCLVWLYNVR